jgi:CIC family chloride channel protein
MAALFAGTARSPITAVVIVLEMSNDYRLILPLLMTVVITTLLADFLHPDTIYTRKLRLRGIRLESGQDIDLLQAVTVREVISRDYMSIPPDMTIAELYALFDETHHHGFPIVDDHGDLLGIITLSDIERVYDEEGKRHEQRTVLDVGTTRNLITVYLDDPIYQALKRMNMYSIGRLPVVTRDNPREYVGMIRRADVLRAYDVSLRRKIVESHRKTSYQLRDVAEQKLIEVTVQPNAPIAGQKLKDFCCSDACHIVTIIHQGQIVIPTGETQIFTGDQITAYIDVAQEERVMRQFRTQEAVP